MPAWWKEGCLEAQGERLLQDLVSREKTLVAKVEETKTEAAASVEKAHADAAKLLAEAKAKAEAVAKAEADAAAKEAEAAREEVVRVARETAEALKAKAAAHRDRAVAAVMEKVLP